MPIQFQSLRIDPLRMARLRIAPLALGALSGLAFFGLAAPRHVMARPAVPEATVVAISPTYTWNGVTVSRTGRLFVSMQRDTPASTTPSVGEIQADGSIAPFPGGAWNTYQYGQSGHDQFVGINSVVSDANDQLWVVDPAGIGGKPIKGPSIRFAEIVESRETWPDGTAGLTPTPSPIPAHAQRGRRSSTARSRRTSVTRA